MGGSIQAPTCTMREAVVRFGLSRATVRRLRAARRQATGLATGAWLGLYPQGHGRGAGGRSGEPMASLRAGTPGQRDGAVPRVRRPVRPWLDLGSVHALSDRQGPGVASGRVVCPHRTAHGYVVTNGRGGGGAVLRQVHAPLLRLRLAWRVAYVHRARVARAEKAADRGRRGRGGASAAQYAPRTERVVARRRVAGQD